VTRPAPRHAARLMEEHAVALAPDGKRGRSGFLALKWRL
jgi:hypothetical protein